MRYTLLSRFQGTLLGAAIADTLGAHCDPLVPSYTHRPWIEVEQWGFQQLGQEAAALAWRRAAAETLRCLAQAGSVGPASLSSPDGLCPTKLTQTAEWAVALLPLALFHHEEPDRLIEQVKRAIAPLLQGQPLNAQSSEHEMCEARGVLLISHTLSLILREQLQPNQLISQLIADLQLSQADPDLAQHLGQLQRELDRGASLQTIALNRNAPANIVPILLALGAFLKTPEDFRLSLLGVAQASSPFACILTGALSGAYNGKAGLPLSWRRSLRKVPENLTSKTLAPASPTFSPPACFSPLWDVQTEAELLEWGHSLFAGWSGVYSSIRSLQTINAPNAPVVIAAPRTMRR